MKGAQGDTGSSVDYPFTIVNNLTTDDATQALSAAMGVVLEGEITQLEHAVGEIDRKDFLSCLALTQAEYEALTKVPRCVLAVGVKPDYSPNEQLYIKYCGKRKNQSNAVFRVANASGTSRDSITVELTQTYGIAVAQGTYFTFLIDLRALYRYDNHTGDGNFYDYGTTLPLDIPSTKNTILSRIIANYGDLNTALSGKVDKGVGKGLSTNDFTDDDKAILGQMTMDKIISIFGFDNELSYTYSTGRLTEYVPAYANKTYKIDFSCDNAVVEYVRITAYDDEGTVYSHIDIEPGESGTFTTPEGTTRFFIFSQFDVSGETTADITLHIDSDLVSIEQEIDGKGDKVEGKGLSTNDFTDEYKEAVDGIFGETTTKTYTKSSGRLSEFIAAKPGKRYKISFTSDNATWPD